MCHYIGRGARCFEAGIDHGAKLRQRGGHDDNGESGGRGKGESGKRDAPDRWDEAGIGIRTVFRHFDDMDSLYSEISATIAERVMPIVTAPYLDNDWRANMRDLARRRVRVFETMLPFRLAANIKRYQSPFLMAEYGRVITVERELVMRLLPAPVLANKVAAEALCATLSFQNWRALRHDQGLPAEEAGTVTAHMVEALLAALPQGGDR